MSSALPFAQSNTQHAAQVYMFVKHLVRPLAIIIAVLRQRRQACPRTCSWTSWFGRTVAIHSIQWDSISLHISLSTNAIQQVPVSTSLCGCKFRFFYIMTLLDAAAALLLYKLCCKVGMFLHSKLSYHNADKLTSMYFLKHINHNFPCSACAYIPPAKNSWWDFTSLGKIRSRLIIKLATSEW